MVKGISGEEFYLNQIDGSVNVLPFFGYQIQFVFFILFIVLSNNRKCVFRMSLWQIFIHYGYHTRAYDTFATFYPSNNRFNYQSIEYSACTYDQESTKLLCGEIYHLTNSKFFSLIT